MQIPHQKSQISGFYLLKEIFWVTLNYSTSFSLLAIALLMYCTFQPDDEGYGESWISLQAVMMPLAIVAQFTIPPNMFTSITFTWTIKIFQNLFHSLSPSLY